MEIIKYTFEQHGDDRGELVALEELKDIPFEIRRVYYVYQTVDGVTRGYHSHKTLKQILICVSGKCRIILDDGKERESILLDKPYEGLYIGPDMWREMTDFTSDAVLLVLASELYNEDDYIRDYEEFLSSLIKP